MNNDTFTMFSGRREIELLARIDELEKDLEDVVAENQKLSRALLFYQEQEKRSEDLVKQLEHKILRSRHPQGQAPMKVDVGDPRFGLIDW